MAQQEFAAGGTVLGVGSIAQRNAGDPVGAQQSGTPANDLELQRKAIEFIVTQLKRMRYFRRQYDLRRAEFYRMYLNLRDQRFYPDNITPRSNTFVPYPFSNCEAVCARVMDAFFSAGDWFEAKGKPGETTDEQADQMQMVLDDRMHKAEFIKQFESLIKNLLIYGNAGIKVDWDWGYDTVVYSEPIPATAPMLDPMTGQPTVGADGQPVMQPIIDPTSGQPLIAGYRPATKQVPRARPKFLPIDIYDLLIDPDGTYVAHLTERTWRDLRIEFESNPERYFSTSMEELSQRLSNEDNPDEVVIRLAEFWNRNDNTWAILTFGEDPEGISFKDLRASFRAASYSPYKRRVYAGPSILLWQGENPFLHKRPPILYTDFIRLPGEIFGLGMIEVTADLADALNRFVNMIADNWNLGINHRYAYDVNAEIDYAALQKFNVPGGKVGVVGNPQEVIFPLPFFTPAAGDYQILELYRGMMEMASGMSDFYSKGVGSPTNNKTATGINQIIQETNFRIRSFIRNLELDILQPILEMVTSMIQQFMQGPMQIESRNPVPGQPPVLTIDPTKLIGTYEFNIVAANYATSRTVRQRNLMALANVVSQSPYIDQYTALRELLKAFEIPNIDRMLKSPNQVQMEQQQQEQKQLEYMMIQEQIQATAKAQASASVRAEGRPRESQFEGQIPGGNEMSAIRDFAQAMGSNAMGTAGMEGEPGTGG